MTCPYVEGQRQHVARNQRSTGGVLYGLKCPDEVSYRRRFAHSPALSALSE
jgi:hypothetical protein